MDWIEKLTGLNLDDGNGSVELAITLLVLVMLCVVALSVWQVLNRQTLR